MARRYGGVFRRKGTPSFYFKADGQFIRLCRIEEGMDEAERQRARKITELEFANASPGRPLDTKTCGSLVPQYLNAIKGRLTAKEYSNKRRVFSLFLAQFGDVEFARLGARVPGDWIESVPTWGPGGKCNAAKHLRAWSRWLYDHGKVTEDRLRGLKAGRIEARDLSCIPTREEFRLIYDKAPDWMKDILLALHDSGCRPGAVLGLTAEEVWPDFKCWQMKNPNATKKGKPKVVVLTPRLQALTRKLVEKHGKGRLFRGREGGSPLPSYFAKRFKEVALEAGIPPERVKQLIPYGFRHGFTVSARETGIGIEDVASFLGHKNTKMIEEHYGHALETIHRKAELLAKLQEHWEGKPTV